MKLSKPTKSNSQHKVLRMIARNEQLERFDGKFVAMNRKYKDHSKYNRKEAKRELRRDLRGSYCIGLDGELESKFPPLARMWESKWAENLVSKLISKMPNKSISEAWGSEQKLPTMTRKINSYIQVSQALNCLEGSTMRTPRSA